MRGKVGERQRKLLEMVVEEYICNAVPISSGYLKKKYNLPVSPATIRLDLGELTKKGFLEKAYISGGRVPTDKGYRFFINNISSLKREEWEDRVAIEFEKAFQEMENQYQLCQTLSESLSAFSSNLSIIWFREQNILWKAGWSKVIDAPEFQEVEYWKKFISAVDELEQVMRGLDLESEKPIAYIGKESPIRTRHFSMVIGEEKGEEKEVFALVGPKRMDFRKNLSLLECLMKTLRKL